MLLIEKNKMVKNLFHAGMGYGEDTVYGKDYIFTIDGDVLDKENYKILNSEIIGIIVEKKAILNNMDAKMIKESDEQFSYSAQYIKNRLNEERSLEDLLSIVDKAMDNIIQSLYEGLHREFLSNMLYNTSRYLAHDNDGYVLINFGYGHTVKLENFIVAASAGYIPVRCNGIGIKMPLMFDENITEMLVQRAETLVQEQE